MPDTFAHYGICDRPTDTRAHLDRAAIALFRASDCRIGPTQYQYLEDAAEHLEQAGQPGLADKLLDDHTDLRSIENALRELLGGK